MSPWFRSPLLNLLRTLFFRNKLAMRQNSLLWVLTIATEQGRPLGPMLEALAEDESAYHWKARLQELVKHLNAGMSLPDAIDRVPGLLPPNVVLAIRVGAETGTLAEMLREVSKDFSARHEDNLDSELTVTVAYLVGLFAVLTAVTGFMMYVIIPKFKKIFEDFGTELPEVTKWVINVSDEFVRWSPLIVIGGISLIAWAEWRSRRGTPTAVFRWMLFSHARGQAPVVLRILGVVIQAGRPLVGALSTMARHHASPTVRNHLLFIRNEVERGDEAFALLFETGFLRRSESRILEAAQRAGNLPWAMEELSGSIDRDASYRIALVVEIIRPAFILALAVCVGIFAIGMFMPLIKLLNDLS
jgi:general secretion pathway protein F